MTVSELIHLLKQFPPDLRVVVNGYEEVYDDLSPVQHSVADIALNIGKHRWEGMHGDLHVVTGTAPVDGKVAKALALKQESN